MVKYSSRFKSVVGGFGYETRGWLFGWACGFGGFWAGSAMLWVWGRRCRRRCLTGVLVRRCSIGVPVLTRMGLVAAGGGEACSDIEVLRAEPEVFGVVPSVSTVHRTFTAMTAEQVEAFASTVAEVRQRVWPMIGGHPGCRS